MAYLITTDQGTASLEARPSGGAFLNVDNHDGKAISLPLTLDQLNALRTDATTIIRKQTER